MNLFPVLVMEDCTEDYVDMLKTILVVRAKVTKPDGTDLDADTKVGPVNNFLHSLFKQVDVYLKGKQVTQATGTYAYRSYIETLLNYGPASKHSQLTAALYYKDTTGCMDAADPTLTTAAANVGLKQRYKFSQQSGVIELAGPIYCDVFFSERLMLSYVDVKVVLTRNTDEFCLMSSAGGADFRVKFVDANLKVRKVKVNPSVSLAHEIALKKGPAIYPIRRVECKSFVVPAGNPSVKKESIFGMTVPQSFVFGLVRSRAFNGDFRDNPFNFQNFNMSTVTVTVNDEAIPYKPFKLSFGANRMFIEAYCTQFSGTGKMYYDVGNDISREEFANGFCLIALDLSADMCGSSTHFSRVQKGSLSLEIQFSNALTEAVNLVCYGNFDNVINIDEDREVLYEYSR